MTMYNCQLLRVRPGLLAGVSTKPIGDPAVFDLDLGEGGDSTVRDVMLTLIRQSVRSDADPSDYRVRVSDLATGEAIEDFGVTG